METLFEIQIIPHLTLWGWSTIFTNVRADAHLNIAHERYSLNSFQGQTIFQIQSNLWMYSPHTQLHEKNTYPSTLIRKGYVQYNVSQPSTEWYVLMLSYILLKILGLEIVNG